MYHSYFHISIAHNHSHSRDLVDFEDFISPSNLFDYCIDKIEKVIHVANSK